MNAAGADVVKSMPIEMSEWIRDSTSLWVKNKGAGNPTTEEEITSLKTNASLNELKEYYEKKIAVLEDKI